MLEREGGTASCVNVTSKHAITIRKVPCPPPRCSCGRCGGARACAVGSPRIAAALQPQDFVSASGRPMTAGGRSGADEMHFAYDRVFGEESDQVKFQPSL